MTQARKKNRLQYHRIISYVALSMDNRNIKHKNELLMEMIVNYTNYQLKSQGAKIDCRQFLQQSLIWSTKSNEAYWNEVILSMPSNKNSCSLIGHQYIFRIPSTVDFKDTISCGNQLRKPLEELYRLLLGDLAVRKIELYISPGDLRNEILNQASYDYLNKMHSVESLEELVYINIDSVDRQVRDLIHRQIAKILWNQLKNSSEYVDNNQKYEATYASDFCRTFLCLIRALDSDGHINSKMFHRMLCNFSVS